LVLRLATSKDNDNLLREARLAAFLSPKVGYPTLVEAGRTEGFAWTLATRLPGRSLGEVWADLRWEERVTALRGLWERAEAVHSVPATAASTIARLRAWFNSTDAEEAEACLARLATDGILAVAERRVLRDALDRFWSVLSDAPLVLCHGDLTLDNAVWHAGRVIALLDFEFAVMAPVQLDLNHLVKCAFGPEDANAASSATGLGGTQQLRCTVAELASPILAQAGNRDLLIGYAILLELWLLELWLAHPEGEGPREQWDPFRRLRSLGDGAGGYLAPLICG
jgi:scyllo-inosamine 4-kinase